MLKTEAGGFRWRERSAGPKNGLFGARYRYRGWISGAGDPILTAERGA